MKDPRSIIRYPIVTEKSLMERDLKGQYTFVVAIDANKDQVKRAIEAIFHVHVTDVNIMKVKGKRKRMGRFEGKQADWKKAIVKLAADERIEELTGGA